MKKKTDPPAMPGGESLYSRVTAILDQARSHVVRSVNSTQVAANWLIGREIVEEEQRGKKRAGYGEELIENLSKLLSAQFGRGYGARHLEMCRRFFLLYPKLLPIPDAVRSESGDGVATAQMESGPDSNIPNAVRSESDGTPTDLLQISFRQGAWESGQIHSDLSWTHYRVLLRVEKPGAREFYEGECIQARWSIHGGKD